MKQRTATKGQKTMNIESLTIGEAREIAGLFGKSQASDNPYKIGANYFIRTVTHHHTGKLVRVTEHELVLNGAAWIADDGRLTEALRTCEFDEVEMFPAGDVIVGRGSIIDAVEISTTPTSQK
jgi:hypothetical protein